MVCNWANQSGCKEEQRLAREAATQSGGIQMKGPEVHSTEIGLVNFTSLTTVGLSFWSMVMMFIIIFGCCILAECGCRGVSHLLHAICNYRDRSIGSTARATRTATPEQPTVAAIPATMPAHQPATVFNTILPQPACPTFFNSLYANPQQLYGQQLSRQAKISLQAVGVMDPAT